MDIRICIAELLSFHDCVIIPGLGGLIGNYSPARIDPVYHSFQPPEKKLLFNINLKQNDGLLANAVAGSSGVSYADACSMIESFTDECRTAFRTGNPFLIPQVGQLYAGKEGIIHFEQDKTTNLLPEAFGLAPFISPPVIRHTSVLNPDRNSAGRKAELTGKRIFIPRAARWAAAFALPIGLAAVIGLTQYDKISANFTSTAGIMSSVLTKFSEASMVKKKTAPVLVLPKKAVQPAPEPVVVKQPAISHDDRFAVIVGAFRIKENAEKLVTDLQSKGLEASIFDQSRTGLFRVTIGTSSDRDDAKQLLASAKSTEFSEAWLLAK